MVESVPETHRKGSLGCRVPVIHRRQSFGGRVPEIHRRESLGEHHGPEIHEKERHLDCIPDAQGTESRDNLVLQFPPEEN